MHSLKPRTAASATNTHHEKLRPFQHDAARMAEIRRRLGREMPGAPLGRMSDEQVLRTYRHHVEKWLAAEQAGARRRRAVGLGSASEEATAAAPAAEERMKEATKTFFAIEAVNARGEAVPDLRYRVKLADSSVREGRLDDKGCARLNGVPEGSCALSFPDLNEGDWKLG